MRSAFLGRALRVAGILYALAIPISARAQAPNCDKLRAEAAAAQKAVEEARTGGDKDKIAAAEKKYNEALAKWRACLHPETVKPAAAGKTAQPCEEEARKLQNARTMAWADPRHPDQLPPGVRGPLEEYCSCLKKKGVHPLPEECEDVGGAISPGDASQCDAKKAKFDSSQKAYMDSLVGGGQGAKGNADELKKEAENARESYCKCVVKMGVKPLPEVCQDFANMWMGGVGGLTLPPPPPRSDSTVPKSEAPPKTPSPPKTTPPPPPSKTAAPPPPPPPKAPPPPPSSSAVPQPSGSSSSNYMCGKSVCDCMKQSPPKVCKAGSGCACTKG